MGCAYTTNTFSTQVSRVPERARGKTHETCFCVIRTASTFGCCSEWLIQKSYSSRYASKIKEQQLDSGKTIRNAREDQCISSFKEEWPRENITWLFDQEATPICGQFWRKLGSDLWSVCCCKSIKNFSQECGDLCIYSPIFVTNWAEVIFPKTTAFKRCGMKTNKKDA